MSDGPSDPWDLFQKVLQEVTTVESRPRILYHFTTVATLRKILEAKVLWASHAATLNDAKELVWCAERAKERVRVLAATGRLDSHLAEDIVKFIAGAPLPLGPQSSLETSHLPCVVSMCETASYSEQWLHYGRDGCGVALGFDAETLRPEHLELIKVDYLPTTQDQSIDRLLLVAQTGLQAVSASERTILAHKCAEWLKYLAPTMKHNSFVHEMEWRFMSTQVLINGRALLDENEGLKLRWRDDSGRLVGYVEMPFETAHLQEIVLGYSAATDVDAVRAFGDSLGFRARVIRSEVPVRPVR